jgi:hypothetical protein
MAGIPAGMRRETMNLLRVWDLSLALPLVVLALPVSVRAEDYVSEQHGFRFRVPDGFQENHDDTPLTLKMFSETDESAGDYLITIHVQALGTKIDPAQRLTSAEIPKREGFVITPEIRRWKELDLQALRQDVVLGPDQEFVGYLIQFPLTEAIQIRVQGPKNRADEVRRVFDQSVQSFEPTKPYIVRMEKGDSEAKTQNKLMLLGLIPALGLFFYFVVWKRIKGGRSCER